MIRTIVCLLFSCSIFTAQSSDFDEVLATVVGNNLSLKSVSAENAAEIASMKADNSLDAPEIGFENMWGAKGIGDKRSLSISQGFDWPGVYAARREAIRHSKNAMQFLNESAELELRMEVRLLLIDIIYAKQRISATEKICSGLASLASSFKKAMEEGNETRLDYNKSVIERIAAERELKSMKGEYSILLSSLQNLNGGKEVLGLVEKLGDRYPDISLETLRPNIETLRNNDPALAASLANADAQQSLLKVEKRSLLPGFTIGYAHEWEMGDQFNGFSISVSLPFITGKKKVKAAALRHEVSKLQLEMDLIKLSASMQGDYEQALLLRELLDDYEGVMDDDSNVTLLKKAFDGGQINFLTYMQELNFFLAAHRDFLETLYNYNQTIARLQKYN